MKTNKKTKAPAVAAALTHEGGRAVVGSNVQQLRRTLLSCFLFEDNFYENGVSISERLSELVKANSAEVVSALAIEARTKFHLRHAPLFIAREMCRHKKHLPYLATTLEQIILRVDEISEFLGLYWKGETGKDKSPIANQAKKGLAAAFNKFSEYNFAKYDRDNDVKIRDVMFLVHPKPDDVRANASRNVAATRKAKFKNEAKKTRALTDKETLFRKIAQRELATPDTWEVAISACKTEAEKKTEWTRLLNENKLGGLAFLRNLRNMNDAGVNKALIKSYFGVADFSRVLPFRFISAAKYAPNLQDELEQAMLAAVGGAEKLSGRTVLIIDVSGSMEGPLSAKSENTRLETAAALAILAREICEYVDVYTFSDSLVAVPNRRGFALRDAIDKSQPHSGTNLAHSLGQLHQKDKSYDRIIVFTDEQSADGIIAPKAKGYLINVANNKNGLDYKKWVHIDGFSDSVIDFIRQLEGENLLD